MISLFKLAVFLKICEVLIVVVFGCRKLWSGLPINLLGSALVGGITYSQCIIRGLLKLLGDMWKKQYGCCRIWIPQGTGIFLICRRVCEYEMILFHLEWHLVTFFWICLSGTNQGRFILRKTWFFPMLPMLISVMPPVCLK